MKQYCCNCIHYLHGLTENPCAVGMKKVGYLREGCWRWQVDRSQEVTMPTRVCGICGRTLPIEQFYVQAFSKDGYSYECKECLPWREMKKQRKKCNGTDND